MLCESFGILIVDGDANGFTGISTLVNGFDFFTVVELDSSLFCFLFSELLVGLDSFKLRLSLVDEVGFETKKPNQLIDL